jgi:hypothetical protein
MEMIVYKEREWYSYTERYKLDSIVRLSDLLCAQNGCFIYSKLGVRFLGEIIIM